MRNQPSLNIDCSSSTLKFNARIFEILISITLFLLIFACAAPSTNGIPPTASTVPTSTQIPEQIDPLVETATEIPTLIPTEQPTETPFEIFDPIVPEIVQLCPSQPEVEFGSLGFESEFNIIVSNNELSGTGIWVLNSSAKSINAMPNTDPGEGVVLYETSSPSGEWIALFSYPSHIDPGEKLLEVIRNDGTNRTPVKQVISSASVFWTAEDRMMVFGKAYQNGPYVLLLTINPFTLEETVFGYTPDEIYYFESLISSGNPYGIFYDDYFEVSPNKYEPHFILVDYLSLSETPVLSWLDKELWFGRGPGLIYRNLRIFAAPDEEINFVVETPYGLDMFLGAEINDLNQDNTYESVMTPISLPGLGPNIRIVWTSSEAPYFAFDRLDINQLEPRPSSFYTFDAENLKVIDYCVDRGHVGPSAIASQDERFLAWTIYEIEGGISDPTEIVILDTKTGYYTRYPEVEFLGWVSAGD